MAHISILFPAIKTHANAQDKLVRICSKTLGFKKNDIELFKLVPLTREEKLEVDLEEMEIAVRVHNSSITMAEIEKIIQQKDRYKEQFQEATEVLCVFIKELQKIRKYFMDMASESSKEGKSNKAITVQAMKYKKLEDDNVRLKSLLKTQLENSENLRLETQLTVEALREEFDVLIKVSIIT